MQNISFFDKNVAIPVSSFAFVISSPRHRSLLFH